MRLGAVRAGIPADLLGVDEAGDGRCTLVYVERIEDPLVASRSEAGIAGDLAVALGQVSPLGRHDGGRRTGQEQLF